MTTHQMEDIVSGSLLTFKNGRYVSIKGVCHSSGEDIDVYTMSPKKEGIILRYAFEQLIDPSPTVTIKIKSNNEYFRVMTDVPVKNNEVCICSPYLFLKQYESIALNTGCDGVQYWFTMIEHDSD